MYVACFGKTSYKELGVDFRKNGFLIFMLIEPVVESVTYSGH